MYIKKFLKTALFGIKESLLEIAPLFAWMGSCFICSLILLLIFKEAVDENGCMFGLIAILGPMIGTGVYAFITRVNDTMKIMEESGVDYKTAWRQSEDLGEDY